MVTDSLRAKIWDIADNYYSSSDWAHGRSHVERVVKTALEIGRQEGADLEVVEIATILHDIYENKEAHAGIVGFRHEIEGSRETRDIMTKVGVSNKTTDAVCHCIESHRKRSGKVKPQTIEAKVLFDADKLDCIGAIGIIRSAAVSFDHRQEFYKRVGDIEAYKRRNIGPDGTIIDYSQHSSNLEYELSLKAVAERMYTKTGRRLAKERAAFMDEFYDRFGKELEGSL